MAALEEFKAEIAEFLDRTKMAPTTFGKRAVNDAMFMQKLAEGREPKITTAEKIRDYMAAFKQPG